MSWFQEISVDDENKRDSKTETKNAIQDFDDDLESRISRRAKQSCFVQYLIEKHIGTDKNVTSGTKITILGGSDEVKTNNKPKREDSTSHKTINNNHEAKKAEEDKMNDCDGGEDDLNSTGSSISELSDDVEANRKPGANKEPRQQQPPSPSPSPDRTENDDDDGSKNHQLKSNDDKEKSLSVREESENNNTLKRRAVSAKFSTRAPFSFPPSSNQQNNNNNALQVALPEDAFLSALPVSTSTISVFGSRVLDSQKRTSTPSTSSSRHHHQQQNNNLQNNITSNNSSNSILLRKLYEPQVQTLEVKNLPGFVVFADIECSGGESSGTTAKTCGSSGRFLLLASYPLFDEEELANGKEENANDSSKNNANKITIGETTSPVVSPSRTSSPHTSPPSRLQQARLLQQQQHEQRKQDADKKFASLSCRPTGWRIVYFAPRNQNVKLRLLVLKSSCGLLQKNLIKVVAFGSNFKVSSGATRSCYSSPDENGKENKTESSSWMITCGGAGGSSADDFFATKTSSSNSLVLPLGFLRPIGVPINTDNDGKQKSKIEITGFEAGWMNSENSSPQNFVWAVGVSAVKKDQDEEAKFKLEPSCNLSTFHVDPTYNTSWTLSLISSSSARNRENKENNNNKEAKQTDSSCLCASCHRSTDDDDDDDTDIVSAHSATLCTGQLPSSAPQVVSARQKYIAWSNILKQQTLSINGNTIVPSDSSSSKGASAMKASINAAPDTSVNNVDLKSVPPEFWHLQRKLNSQNVGQMLKKRNAIPNTAREF